VLDSNKMQKLDKYATVIKISLICTSRSTTRQISVAVVNKIAQKFFLHLNSKISVVTTALTWHCDFCKMSQCHNNHSKGLLRLGIGEQPNPSQLRKMRLNKNLLCVDKLMDIFITCCTY